MANSQDFNDDKSIKNDKNKILQDVGFVKLLQIHPCLTDKMQRKKAKQKIELADI